MITLVLFLVAVLLLMLTWRFLFKLFIVLLPLVLVLAVVWAIMASREHQQNLRDYTPIPAAEIGAR